MLISLSWYVPQVSASQAEGPLAGCHFEKLAEGQLSSYHGEPERAQGFPTLVDQEKAFQITVPDAAGNSHVFIVRFQRPSSWGGGPQAAVGLDLCTTVSGPKEAEILFNALARAPSLWQGTDVQVPSGGNAIYRIAGFVEGYMVKPEMGVKGKEDGSGELRIFVPERNHIAANAVALEKILEHYGLSEVSFPHLRADLNTKGGLREWAYYSFLKWSDSLSHPEIIALRAVAEAPFKDIHAYLEADTQKKVTRPDLEATIGHIDSAIARGKVNRDIKVYRVDSGPDIAALWSQLHTSRPHNLPMPKRKAYTFTSLDKDVAEWWNRDQLGGKGIFLEIHVPAGANAAFIDCKAVHPERGYLELLFPRESSFTAIEATTNSDGTKVLKVRLELSKKR